MGSLRASEALNSTSQKNADLGLGIFLMSQAMFIRVEGKVTGDRREENIPQGVAVDYIFGLSQRKRLCIGTRSSCLGARAFHRLSLLTPIWERV